jgi:hypothetical protein
MTLSFPMAAWVATLQKLAAGHGDLDRPSMSQILQTLDLDLRPSKVGADVR